MQTKSFFVVTAITVSLICCNPWVYRMVRKVKFEWIHNITASGMEEPKPRIIDAENSYNYHHQDPFQHQKKLKKLGNLVQKRLHYLQNPVSCNSARKIKCIIHHNCGFGCQKNTIGFCLMLGYAKNRTVIVQGPSMHSLIEPLSSTCTSAVEKKSRMWGKGAERFKVVSVMIVRLPYKDAFFPPAIPEDLADTIAHFHSYPFLWWAGQISSYVFRPTRATSKFLRRGEKRLGFSSPIVGIHIRRTDKLVREAKYHFLDEYMVLVGRWYSDLEQSFPRVSRRLFVATDDPGVMFEIRTRYPEYKILHNGNFSTSAKNLRERKTKYGHLGIIHDIHMLSKCDYLVCTFSSNICRFAYQLMQSQRGNATHRAVSLDWRWFFYGQRFKFNTNVIRVKMPVYGNPKFP